MDVDKQIWRVFGLIVFILCGLSLNASAVDQGFPMTVTDAHGVVMTIQAKPQRIVSLTLSMDEMLLSLVDHSRIAALSGKIADDPGVSNVAELAKHFPKVENNTERLITLQPDIVFAVNWMKQEAIQQLRDAGILVYCYETPTNLVEQEQQILTLARMLGEEASGQTIVADMEDRLQAIAGRLAAIKEEEKLTVLAYTLFGTTNAKGTTFDDLATRAGLINVATQAGLSGYAELSKETIVELNPDILIVPSWSYDQNVDPAQFTADLKNDPGLATVNAIVQNRVYALPEKHLVCTSQYMVLGVEDLARAAYPQLFQ